MRSTGWVVAFVLVAASASAGDNGDTKRTERKPNPLAKLPSKLDPAHAAKIKALGDDSWVNLGQAGPCNRFPRKKLARGRAWGSKMTYAPDMNGAFFCGTGRHGAMPEGYYMDDLWFYDANAHQWICLYPGATQETQCKLDKNGLEVDTKTGDHIPISYLSHTYNNVTYDTDRKKYFIHWTQCPHWRKAIPHRYEWLDRKYPSVAKKYYGDPGNIIKDGKHPLFWDVKTGKWERRFVKGDGPKDRDEGISEYIPSKKQTLRLHDRRVWFYDYPTNKWIKMPGVSIDGGDVNGAYDQKNEKIYVGGKTKFSVYDIKTNTWKQVNAPGRPSHLASTKGGQLHFDQVNDVVLWHGSHGPIFVYDIKKNQWLDIGNPYTGSRLSGCWHGFYHPELNVHLFYVARDSGNDGATWLAYRYKRADSKADMAAQLPQKGKAVHNIQLSIRPSALTYKMGETWAFDARVFNTDKDLALLNFHDSMSYLEIDGPKGPVFPADRKAGVPREVKSRKPSRWLLFAIPGERACWFGSGHEEVKPGKPVPYTKLTWPEFGPGKYRVRWIFRNDTDVPKQHSVRWARKQVKIPEWIGTVVSNEVEITVQ